MCEGRLLERAVARLDCRLDRGLGFVDLRARRRPLRGRQTAETLELLGEQPFLAEQMDARLVELRKVRSRLDAR